jgi:hypothetical protein
MSNSELCMSIDVQCIFCASFCMSNVKNLQNNCQKYTLLSTLSEELSLECEDGGSLQISFKCHVRPMAISRVCMDCDGYLKIGPNHKKTEEFKLSGSSSSIRPQNDNNFLDIAF